MWRLLKAEEETGMALTESHAMLPAASVSGLYFGGKCAQYFGVGKVTQDQVASYASRKGTSVGEVQKWLGHMLKCACPSLAARHRAVESCMRAPGPGAGWRGCRMGNVDGTSCAGSWMHAEHFKQLVPHCPCLKLKRVQLAISISLQFMVSAATIPDALP